MSSQFEWWTIYENSSKGVYVVNTDTHKILYLNKYLRDMLGIKSHEEYLDKRCCEVVEILRTACTFCRTDRISEGELYKWVYYNPNIKKRLLLEDTVFYYNGDLCRIEFITQIEHEFEFSEKTKDNHAECVSNAVRFLSQSKSPYDAIERLLEYTCKEFDCKNAVIYKTKHGYTPEVVYELAKQSDICANSRDKRTNLFKHSEFWEAVYSSKRGIVLDNEYISKERYPVHFAVCAEQDIDIVIIEPLVLQDEVVGYITAVNPPKQYSASVASYLASISFMVVTFMVFQRLIDDCNTVIYSDVLTNTWNERAFNIKCEQIKQNIPSELGIIYCDISIIKAINASLGYQAGDGYIKNYHQIISKVFDQSEIFRLLGDEFVIVSTGTKKEIFDQKVRRLKALMLKNGIETSIGVNFETGADVNITNQMHTAELEMYDNRQKQRSMHFLKTDQQKECRNIHLSKKNITAEDFINYIYNGKNEYSSLVRAISSEDMPYAFFVCDLKNNAHYMSNTIEKRFCIKCGGTCNPFNFCEKHIVTHDELKKFKTCLNELISGKRDRLDLWTRLYDSSKDIVWVRIRVVSQKDEKTGEVLYLTGFISWQELDFAVDLITGFVKEEAVINTLEKIKKRDLVHTVIAFMPNSVREMNEALGRSEADEIIGEIAHKLSSEYGRKIIFFRLDGVRFVAIMRYESEDADQNVISAIHRTIKNIYEKHSVSVVEPCILSHTHYPCNMNPKEFLATCVESLGKAKTGSDDILDLQENQSISLRHKHALMTLALSKSVANNFEGFRIVVQPIVMADSGRIEKGEVLLRWTDGDKQVPPDIFIPLLEEIDLIIPVGKWVFEQTVILCKECIVYRPDFRLAFNISYLQTQDDEFLDFMEETLKKYNLPASHLTLDLAESHLSEDPERLRYFMNRCHELGLEVALADFGNGYSSLGLLMSYPADVIKLDKSFVDAISSSDEHVKFIRSIIYACHEFGKCVITQGVETKKQNDLIRYAGSDVIQGYYHYKPMEIDELHNVLLSKGLENEENHLLYKLWKGESN